MIEYEVGTRPTRPLTLVVKDELDNPVNTVGYDSWMLEMRGTDDEDVDLTGVNILEVPNALGVFSVNWPKNRVIFDKRGKYLLRLNLITADGGRDITRIAEIRVRDFGKVKN